MATSAFKSTSRRGASAAEPKAPPPSRRRSHSVSAASRTTHLPVDEFSNSRDNPLFWAVPSSSCSPPEKEENGKPSNKKQLNSSRKSSISSCNSTVSEERGRSVTRNGGAKNGIGRSLSRVRVYESEKGRDVVVSKGGGSRNDVKQVCNGVHKPNSVRNGVSTRGHSKNARVVSTVCNQETDWSEDDYACSLQISNLDNELSVGSLSEAEEKTIKAVSEDLNIYRRNNVNIVTSTNVVDIPPDLVNPGAVELISDIRRGYATKLEESEERARKLRTNLAIEEHRGQELDRILKEILPDPKTSSAQRPRRGRRTSNERKRMSRRLTEEAMSYFDECVSLSTFDSSDFSAPEDPLFTSSGANLHASASSSVKGNFHQKQFCDDSGTTMNISSISESGSSQLPYDFSFDNKKLLQRDDVEPYEDIRSYIKLFERGTMKDSGDSRSYYYDAGEYSMHGHAAESVLFDRVLYNNRIKSGGLLLCGGSISFMPFA
ncbi:hypothetical protein ACJIZ3_018645 [Penstemon smallii]|uniref:Uncharacterized protein n=1 Tax=Penstemon smallii TaxID=265156 RepID=A0ABD3T055_9LAMI